MYRQTQKQMLAGVCIVVVLLASLNPGLANVYAQEPDSPTTVERIIFLPIITNQLVDQSHETDQLVASFTISVGVGSSSFLSSSFFLFFFDFTFNPIISLTLR